MNKIIFIIFILFLSVPCYAQWGSPFTDFGTNSASQIFVDTSGFGGQLDSTDTTVQEALETLDDLVSGGGGTSVSAWELDANDDLMPVSGSFLVIYWETDGNNDLTPVSG